MDGALILVSHCAVNKGNVNAFLPIFSTSPYKNLTSAFPDVLFPLKKSLLWLFKSTLAPIPLEMSGNSEIVVTKAPSMEKTGFGG